jgi:hypothetical protein
VAGAALSLLPFVTGSSSGCLIVGTVESNDQSVLGRVECYALRLTALAQ